MAPWLGSFPSKTRLRKIRRIEQMYSAFAKDIALLQRRLTGMKKRASYLFSEAQHHQLQMLEQSFSKKVLSNNKRNNLNDVYLDIMSRKVETQQMVTQSGVTKLKIEVSHAAGFTDELQLSPIPSRRKRRKMEHEIDLEDQVTREKGVFRLFQVEGTTGDAAYASSVMVRRNHKRERMWRYAPPSPHLFAVLVPVGDGSVFTLTNTDWLWAVP